MDHADIRGKRLFASRKGVRALNAMRAAIDDVQPSPTYSDYSAAATELSGANTLLRASTPLYEQSRRDAFGRLAARDARMVDTGPARLGVELVNRYQAAKRAPLI